MKATSERIEGCQVEINIEVEPDEMEDALQRAYRSLVNKVIVPGFRKGKAPRNMLERHIGRESLVSEALDRLVPELYQKALDEQQIQPIGRPDLEMVQEEPPIFKAVVAVPPEVELGDYKSIKVTPEEVEVSDEKVDESLENLRHMQSAWEPVDREAAFDDMVGIDIMGEIDGKTVLNNQGGTFRITEGAPVPVPGFSEQIVGMKAGDEKEFTLAFPEDHRTEEVAGKECLFKVAVSEVKQENVPDMDDEFVKALGEDDLQTVDDLRKRMTDNLKAVAEREARTNLEQEIIKQITDLSKIEFPDLFVEQEVEGMISQQLQRMGGMPLETFLGYRGMTEDDLRNELRPVAREKVNSSLVLNKVYEAEGIEVTDEDIDERAKLILEGASSDEEKEQLEQMLSWPQTRDSIKDELLVKKTIDRLVEIATGEETPAVEDSADDAPEETGAEDATAEE